MSCELIFDFQQRFSIWRDGDATCPIWIFRDSLSPGSTRIVKSFDYPLDALKNSRLALRLFVPPCIDLAPLPVRNTPKSVTDSHFWQFPVICERLAFEQHAKLEAKCSLDNVLPINTYLGLPWASYIDKKKVPPLVRQIFGVRLHGYRTLANEWGLRWGQDLSVHTVCQHVQWKCMLSVWRELGVTDVHLTHCEPRSAVFAKQYGIRVYSWPLVAANVVNEGRREGLIFGKQLIEKQFLASFIGTHMPHYRSDIRLHLRKEALQDNGTDILLELTDDWHFETTVYQEQVNGQAMNISQLATEHLRTVRYNKILSDSIFSLCPEGAGPNTIRLWESLAVGAIPVVIAEDWIWPSIPNPALQWEDCVIHVKRNEVSGIFERLRQMRATQLKRLSQMQVNGMKVYKYFQNLLCF